VVIRLLCFNDCRQIVIFFIIRAGVKIPFWKCTYSSVLFAMTERISFFWELCFLIGSDNSFIYCFCFLPISLARIITWKNKGKRLAKVYSLRTTCLLYYIKQCLRFSLVPRPSLMRIVFNTRAFNRFKFDEFRTIFKKKMFNPFCVVILNFSYRSNLVSVFRTKISPTHRHVIFLLFPSARE